MLEEASVDRRAALLAVAGIGALATLQGCRRDERDEDMSATEDMMREYGVLRRILVAYRESAAMLRSSTRFDVAALVSLARMYEAHTAREDTIVFPAWRESLSEQAMKEAGEAVRGYREGAVQGRQLRSRGRSGSADRAEARDCRFGAVYGDGTQQSVRLVVHQPHAFAVQAVRSVSPLRRIHQRQPNRARLARRP